MGAQMKQKIPHMLVHDCQLLKMCPISTMQLGHSLLCQYLLRLFPTYDQAMEGQLLAI